MKFGDELWYKKKHEELIKAEARIKYKDRLKVFLSLSIDDIPKSSPLGETLRKVFPNADPNTTLDELRVMKLFDKIFVESSMKAMELSYKLDGSMNDLVEDPDFDEIDVATEGIK